MEILDLERTANPERWIRQLESCDWAGGQYLRTLLAEGRFHELYGEKSRVLILADGTKPAAFCTCAEKDDIPDTDLTPWLGFAYTWPEYRGRRLMGRLIARAKELAREDGHDAIWIASREEGLYEKYGAEYVTDMADLRGENSAVFRMDTYGFYGWRDADVKAQAGGWPGIETPKDLYNALWHVWRKETCATRMQPDWSEDNRTLGQCSITAFLVQDIFGGRVYGVPLEDGNVHCFNEAGGKVFDLTSEQFGGEQLEYTLRYEQQRQDHLGKAEKRERYEMLKAGLRKFIIQNS